MNLIWINGWMYICTCTYPGIYQHGQVLHMEKTNQLKKAIGPRHQGISLVLEHQRKRKFNKQPSLFPYRKAFKKKSTCHSLFFSRRLKLRHDHPSGTPRKRCSSPLRRFGRSLVLKGSSLSSAASGSRLSSGRSILNLLTLPSRFPLLALPSSKKGVKSGEGWIHLGASFRHRRRIPRLERSIFSYCCLRVAADVQSITVDGAER